MWPPQIPAWISWSVSWPSVCWCSGVGDLTQRPCITHCLLFDNLLLAVAFWFACFCCSARNNGGGGTKICVVTCWAYLIIPTFGSRRISLVERSHSSFCFLWFCFICVQVRIFLFLPVTSTRAISGRSRPMRAEFPIGTHRCRSIEEVHSLLAWRECAYRERHCFCKNSDISVEASFELHLL
jgi:hypothetical protein